MTEPANKNRLRNEKSPYLLQHANNPVDWYPWGEEAFSAAKEQDRPIFLSIGYATCHWCHVMEKESFENASIAKLMNDSFINIKVDREELPEVDGLYMEFAQALMPSGGGWPLNVLLTPELKPFFATTYIPPKSGRGFIGFQELIVRLSELWKESEEREKLIEQAERIIEVFQKQENQENNEERELPAKEEITNASELLFHMADPIYGGIEGEPKFPMGYHACFLLTLTKLSNDSRALFCVELTLDMMQRGGIYDHLGGGFSRYSVDSKWLIPHFEKMLYDNAVLIRAYLEAWLFTKKPFYEEVCKDILRYLLREMCSSEGAFYSAEDADSEGHEGRFYTWDAKEILSILGETDGPLFIDYFCVSKAEGAFEGRSILHIKHRIEEFSAKRKLDVQETSTTLNRCKEILWKEREKRAHPFKDDKILSSWNGLMIHSLAMAGRAFKDDKYTEGAKKAARFIKSTLWKDGHLLRRWRDSDARFAGGLDEYAFMIHGLLTLFEEDGEVEWYRFALELAEVLESEFKAENGAFYLTDGKDPNIVLRRCEFYDGAEPAGNGIHAENLLRLYQITFDERFLKQAEEILKAATKHIEHHPVGCCSSLMALQRYYDRHGATIVIALNEAEEFKKEIKNILYSRYLPHHVTIWRKCDNSLFEIIPRLKDQGALDGKTTLYICQRGECQKPLNNWEEIQKTLLEL
ncbi:MAG: thioredoxin domain-containing protein [Chlamydiales bacterium]|nr:thioredoxin domain-containing protein [Chlamydiales bacterium]